MGNTRFINLTRNGMVGTQTGSITEIWQVVEVMWGDGWRYDDNIIDIYDWIPSKELSFVDKYIVDYGLHGYVTFDPKTKTCTYIGYRDFQDFFIDSDDE